MCVHVNFFFVGQQYVGKTALFIIFYLCTSHYKLDLKSIEGTTSMSDQCNDENEGRGDEFENGAKGEAAGKIGKVKKRTDIPNPGYRLVNRKYRGKQR